MIPRTLQEPIRRAATKYPVVAVTGPRQSGKTTLCRALFSDLAYVSLENPQTRAYATEDAVGFLNEYRSGVVLDEVQRAPHLLSFIQERVDESPVPGRYVLTGSEHLGLSRAISQSLAGRVSIHHLLPFSLEELLAAGQAPESLFAALFRGGYPRIYDLDLEPNDWLSNYVATYVERDVRQLLQVTDLPTFSLFLQLCAGRTAQVLNLSSLGNDLGISHSTVKSWLNVLEATFVTFRLPPYFRNVTKRLTRSPKLHFYDSGLVCFLLGIRSPDELLRHPLRGAVFESWVVSEVAKHRLHRAVRLPLLYYRDQRGLEVDLVIESARRLLAVEAKSGQTIASTLSAPLTRFTELVEKQFPETETARVLVYAGAETQSRSGVTYLSWRQLHSFDWD